MCSRYIGVGEQICKSRECDVRTVRCAWRERGAGGCGRRPKQTSSYREYYSRLSTEAPPALPCVYLRPSCCSSTRRTRPPTSPTAAASAWAVRSSRGAAPTPATGVRPTTGMVARLSKPPASSSTPMATPSPSRRRLPPPRPRYARARALKRASPPAQIIKPYPPVRTAYHRGRHGPLHRGLAVHRRRLHDLAHQRRVPSTDGQHRPLGWRRRPRLLVWGHRPLAHRRPVVRRTPDPRRHALDWRRRPGVCDRRAAARVDLRRDD